MHVYTLDTHMSGVSDQHRGITGVKKKIRKNLKICSSQRYKYLNFVLGLGGDVRNGFKIPTTPTLQSNALGLKPS